MKAAAITALLLGAASLTACNSSAASLPACTALVGKPFPQPSGRYAAGGDLRDIAPAGCKGQLGGMQDAYLKGCLYYIAYPTVLMWAIPGQTWESTASMNVPGNHDLDDIVAQVCGSQAQ